MSCRRGVTEYINSGGKVGPRGFITGLFGQGRTTHVAVFLNNGDAFLVMQGAFGNPENQVNWLRAICANNLAADVSIIDPDNIGSMGLAFPGEVVRSLSRANEIIEGRSRAKRVGIAHQSVGQVAEMVVIFALGMGVVLAQKNAEAIVKWLDANIPNWRERTADAQKAMIATAACNALGICDMQTDANDNARGSGNAGSNTGSGNSGGNSGGNIQPMDQGVLAGLVLTGVVIFVIVAMLK